MRKHSLLKTMLLLCALIVGSSSVWAEDYVISNDNFDKPNSGSGYAAYDGNHKINGITIVSSNVMINSSSLQFKKSGGYLYNSDAMPGNIEKITLATSTGFTIYVGTSSNPSTTSVTSGSTISGSYTYFKVINESSSAASTTTITVTYNSGPVTYSVTYNANGANSGTAPTDATAYSSGATVTVLGNTGNLAKTGYAFSGWNTQADGLGIDRQVGSTFDITANTTLYAKWTPYTITAQSNNTTYGTVNLNGFVITATPSEGYRYASPAYTVTTGSATVEQNGNEFTVTPSSNCTVTINFEAIPTHTATFSVNGTTSTQDFAEGAAITFPANPADISDKTFVGWVESAIDGTTNTAPTFVTSATMGSSDVTYYAVFADVSGSTDASWTETAIGSISSSDVIVISDGSYAMNNNNGTSNPPSANSISVSGTSLSEDPSDNLKWNVSGNATDGYTFYPNGTTETWLYCSTEASSGSNNNIRVGTGNRKVWEFDINGYLVTKDDKTNRYLSLYNSQDFRGYINTTNGAFVPKFYKYTAGSATYSNYCTTVVAAAVEKPVITVAENPFLFSTTVTITCGTEGASIKYSYDGETWNDYSEALTITETKTIYAKGVKGDDESSVAQVTATKNLAEPTVTVSGELTLDLNGETNVSAGALTAAVTYTNAAVEGATVTWSSSDTNIATIDASTGAVTLLATGEVTFTATFAGNSDYAQATGTKTITVIDSKAPGTESNPYTVAQARAAIDAGTGVTGVYATGIVSKIVTAYNSQYGNISYNISDDGTTTADQLQAYRGKSYNGNNFTSADDIKVGDVVVIYGDLTKYSSTYEFAADNKLVSLVRPATTATITLSAACTDGDMVYGTYSSSKAFVVSDDIIVSEIGIVDGKLWIENYETGDVVPANTGVLVSALEGGNYTVDLSNEAGTSILGDDNCLRPSGDNGVTAADMADTDYYYYRLTMADGQPGFWWKSAEGAGFTLAANKAYMKVLKTDAAAARGFSFTEDVTTGVEGLKNSKTEELKSYYNIAGQRVAQPTKGLYIVNGKKVVIK